MKLLVLFLMFFILSCQPHVSRPQVGEIRIEYNLVQRDTIDQFVWANDTCADSLRFAIRVLSKNEYRISVNGFNQMMILTPGDTTIAIGWDQFEFEDLIVITAGDPRFPEENVHKEITAGVTRVAKVESLSVPFVKLQHDTVLNLFFSESMKLQDSLRLSLKIRKAGTFALTLNGTTKTVPLLAGDTVLSLSWNSFPLADTLIVTAGEPAFPEEQKRIIAPRSEISTPRIYNLATPYPSIIFDTFHRICYTGDMKPIDSLRISMTVLEKWNYTVTINGVATPIQLNRGDTTLVFGWDQFNFIDSILVTVRKSGDSSDPTTLTIAVKPMVLDRDPLNRYAWHLNKTDSAYVEEFEIDSASHIAVTPVWKTNRGKGIKVAILDQGIQPSHEDLAGNVVAQWNATTQTSQLPTPSGFHGTGVAGMIGALRDNNRGICGVAPECDLILIHFDVDGAPDSEIIRAFMYARNQGARVINCSWGTYGVSQAVADVIKQLYNEGIVVVFAAGNYGRNMDQISINDESELPWVIGAGGSNEKNDYWSGSDFGSNLDLIAPAGGNPGVVLLDGMGSAGSSDQRDYLNENYRFWSGCSFSAPAIAGAAALVLAENPSLTPDQVRSILIQSADKVGGSSANYVEGFDTRRFYGKLNVQKAIELARTGP